MKLHIKQLTKNRVLLAGVSIALAAGISFVVVPTYQKNSTETVTVVSAAHNVAKGEKLSSDNLKEVEIPKKFLPGGVVSAINEAAGEYAAVDLKAGDWLTYEKLSETTALQEWYSKLNAENVAISVTVKSLAAGVSAQLQPGDIISFVSSNSDTDTVIMPQLQYLEVLEISTGTAAAYQKGEETDTSGLPATVTVLAAPEQARLLADQELNSNLHAVLVSRANAQQAEQLLQLQQEILQSSADQGQSEGEIQTQEETDG